MVISDKSAEFKVLSSNKIQLCDAYQQQNYIFFCNDG